MNHNIIDRDSILKDCNNIQLKLNTRSITIYTLLTIVGIATLGVTPFSDDPSSALNMALIVGGVSLIATAIVQLSRNYLHLVYTPSGSSLTKGSEYFENEKIGIMKSLLEECNTTQLKEIKMKSGGNGRIDFFVSGDGNFAAVQLFSYIPYNYETASRIYYFSNDDAQHIRRWLIKK